MKISQQLVFNQLTDVLDQRYTNLNGSLCDAIHQLEEILEGLTEDHPLLTEIHSALQTLVIAADEGAILQAEVTEVLFRQLTRLRSAKQIYRQGWTDRLLSLLSRANPEQSAVIRSLLLNTVDDDHIPF